MKALTLGKIAKSGLLCVHTQLVHKELDISGILF